jgi:hypothetical protein
MRMLIAATSDGWSATPSMLIVDVLGYKAADFFRELGAGEAEPKPTPRGTKTENPAGLL